MIAPQDTPADYRILEMGDIPAVLAATDGLPGRLGGTPADWRVAEISDGNMNRVFLVRGPAGSVVAKQALPFIRVVGEGWPFPLTRIWYEVSALRLQARACPGMVPAVLAFREDLALLVMEELTGFRVLRGVLGTQPLDPAVARDLGRFLAYSLHACSDFALDSAEKRLVAGTFAGNGALCATTEDVIFTSPFTGHPLNRWTPGLEEAVAALTADGPLRAAAAALKQAFQCKAETIIHGDLHTGSVMVADGQVRVIDPEWAFAGPMGFDVGLLLGNLLLAACAAHAVDDGERRRAALDGVETVWTSFATAFADLAAARPDSLAPLPAGSVQDFITARLGTVLADTLGFAGLEMIRRIIGIAHVADFEGIADPVVRARGERAALAIARDLTVNRLSLDHIGAVRGRAESLLQA